MSTPTRVILRGDANAGLLCRFIGVFAQLDLPAPAMNVSINGSKMSVRADLNVADERTLDMVMQKASRFIGVDEVGAETVGG